jgi:hypothetical protein
MYFLLLEAGFRGSDVGNSHRTFLGKANALLASYSDPQFELSYRLSEGSRAYLDADRGFNDAVEILNRSDDVLTQSANAAWEQSAGRFFLIYSLLKLGDFRRLRACSERFTREAEQRGNVYMRTTIDRLCTILQLVDDDPEGAREVMRRNSLISQTEGLHSQYLDQPGLRWMEISAFTEAALYDGSAINIPAFIRRWKAVRYSALRHVLIYRCDLDWLAGRVALYEKEKHAPVMLRRCISNLLAYDTHYSRTLAHMLRATHALQQGNREGAIGAFREAVTLGELTGTSFITAVARRRLGQLMQGDAGRELTTQAERWMTDAGVRDLDRMSNLVSPSRRA